MVPTSDSDCEFCAIAQGLDRNVRVVFRDDLAVAFFPNDPAALGHTLLIPLRHVADIWGLDEQLAGHLAVLTVQLATAVKRAANPTGLSVIQSNGHAASQTVMHLHIHVVPRWEDDDLGQIWPPRESNYTRHEKDQAWEDVSEQCRLIMGHS